MLIADIQSLPWPDFQKKKSDGNWSISPKKSFFSQYKIYFSNEIYSSSGRSSDDFFFHVNEIENKLVVLKLYARMSGKIAKIQLNVKRYNVETEQKFRFKIWCDISKSVPKFC